jgi:hypothetical protein
MSSYERNIGIDFGTSTTVLCYLDHADGRPRSDSGFLTFEDGRPLMESVVYEPSPGSALFGLRARRAAESDQKLDALVSQFKMELLFEEKRTAAEKRMRQLFAYLHEQYEAKRSVMHGDTVRERTFVSYPAKWPQPLREATLDAARCAGFSEVQGMDEPSAAMQFFLYRELGELRTLFRENVVTPGQPILVLLIDLGAGTTDIVLYKTTPGRSEGHKILNIWPPVEGANFGGRDIDALLGSYITDYIEANLNPNVPINSIETPSERLSEIVAHKELVISPKLGEKAVVDRFGYLERFTRRLHILREDAPPYRMDRERFGQLAADHFRTFVELTNGIISDATEQNKIEGADEVDLVVLTGGHSKWYFIREMLCGKWIPGLAGGPSSGSGINLRKIAADPRRCLTDPDPQTIVARGLVLTNMMLDDKPIIIDKCAANSLWYELAINSDQGAERRWNTMVVERNAGLPIQRRVFARLKFDRPLLNSRDCTIVARLVPVVGKTLESGARFAAHPLPSTIRPGMILSDWLKRFLGYTSTGEHLDVYLDITVDEQEQVSYSGIADLDSAKECWSFNYPRRRFRPGEEHALHQELLRNRAAYKKSIKR